MGKSGHSGQFLSRCYDFYNQIWITLSNKKSRLKSVYRVFKLDMAWYFEVQDGQLKLTFKFKSKKGSSTF